MIFDGWMVECGWKLRVLTILGTIKDFGDGNRDFGWFCWDFEDIDKVKFWRKSVDESAIGFAAFPVHAISFCYPPIQNKTTVNLHFSVGLLIKQMLDKIRSGLSEQNKLEHMFV